MLRELIYALNGYHGEVFCWDNDSKSVNVANNLPFIQPSEEAFLKRFCKLASYFVKFKTFTEDILDFSFKTPPTSCGIYLKAFARALDDFLHSYQKEMVELEREVIADECLGLATIQSYTQKYQIIFPVVSGVIDTIVDRKLQGCIILDVLYKASKTGLTDVHAVISKMLQSCTALLYKHLSLWMLHGKLPHSLNNTTPTTTNSNNNNNNNNNNNRNDNHDGENDFFIAQVTTSTDDNINSNQKSETLTKDSFQVMYEINVGQLPSFIPLSLAERILFVGQSVVLFESGRKEKEGVRSTTKGCLIPEDKQKDFKARLASLHRQPFEVFENSVQVIRDYVAQQLYVLIVEKCHLQSQLKKFKDFFLIGRGEVFLTFIDQSQNLLRNPPSNATQYDINMLFEHACRDVLVDESQRKPFSLLINSSDGTTSAASKAFLKGRKSGWACLQMTASVDWPLHVLFTQPIIDKYNRLFSFLLHAKRIQQQLQHCWTLQRGCGRSTLNATKWRVRNHMAFFIDNLQYYLQVDVIESQCSLLTHRLSQHRDFEQVLLDHDTFLSSLAHQCFLNSKQINSCLNNIFDLCQAYYGLVVYSGDEDNADAGDGNNLMHKRLKEIEEAFRKQSTLLFEMLSSNARCSDLLSPLLLRIDFNRYFSSIAT